jgi:hypothetical protein
MPLLTTRQLLVTILFIAISVMAIQPISDTDLWWHLRTGQWISEQRAIPDADPFSWTRAQTPWLAHEWLADVGLYWLYQWGGLPALASAVSVCVTLTFVLVYRMSELRPHVAVFTTLLAAIASAVAWSPRPHLLTMLFAAYTLYVLQRYATQPRWLWSLPPLFLVWANAHSGFVLGLVIIGVTLCGTLLPHWLTRARPFFPPAQRALALCLAVCFSATLLNPHGIALLIYPYFTLTSKAMQTYIVEWHSPNFHDTRFLAFAALLLITLVACALSPRRLTLVELGLLLGLTYAALNSMRNIPLYALVAAPIITRQLHGLSAAHPAAPPAPRPLTPLLNGVHWLLMGIIILGAGLRIANTLNELPTLLVKYFPEMTAQYLLQQKPAGPLLNSYNLGGYLIWRVYPTYQVFIDGRADVYGDAFMDEYYALAWQTKGDWQAYLDRYKINLVVIEKDGPLAGELRASSGWRLLFEDEISAIFQRAS